MRSAISSCSGADERRQTCSANGELNEVTDSDADTYAVRDTVRDAVTGADTDAYTCAKQGPDSSAFARSFSGAE